MNLRALFSRACMGLGLYGAWCSYPTGTWCMHVNYLIAAKIHAYTPTRIWSLNCGIKIASETIFEHLICNIFIWKVVEHTLLVSYIAPAMCMHTLISCTSPSPLPPTLVFTRGTLALTDDILPRRACILTLY